MRIDELFDKPPVAKDNYYPDVYFADAVIGGRKISFHAERVAREDDWGNEDEQGNEDYNKWTVSFSEGDSQKTTMTGSGDEIKVMSFVVSCMQKFIARYNPEKFKFYANASEASRVTVYRRMLKRLKGYTCEEVNRGSEVEFDLTRNDLV